LQISIQNKDISDLNLNFTITLNKKYIAQINSSISDIVLELDRNSRNLQDYLANISLFLENSMEYSLEELPQDINSVSLNRKGNCIGFSNLTATLLKCINVESKFIKGFYLKKENGILKPIPHRWIEIKLANGIKLFYDPQYQDFSANYLVIKENMDMSKIRKFKVSLHKKTRKIVY